MTIGIRQTIKPTNTVVQLSRTCDLRNPATHMQEKKWISFYVMRTG